MNVCDIWNLIFLWSSEKWNAFFFLLTFFHVCKNKKKSLNIVALACRLFPAGMFAFKIATGVFRGWRRAWPFYQRSLWFSVWLHVFSSGLGPGVAQTRNRSCGQSWWTTRELLVEFDSFYFGCFKFQTRPSGGSSPRSFRSTPPHAPIDELLSRKPNGPTLRNLCGRESERGGRAKVPSEAAESGAAARACPSRRIVKTLDAFCSLWVTWSSLLAGNKWRCPAPPQALCAGNWTIAIVIIWTLCRLTPTSIQILLYSRAAGYRLLPSASPPVAAVPETCEQTRWRPFKGSRPPSGTQRLLFPVLLRSDIFPDRMSPALTFESYQDHIPSKSNVTVLYTKCSFINLHASIHIDIHVYVWTLHFTAPSIWKIQRKGKTLTVYLNNSQRGKKQKPKRSHNGKERQLFSSSGKISALRICFTDLEFREQNLPFDVMSRDVALFFLLSVCF